MRAFHINLVASTVNATDEVLTLAEQAHHNELVRQGLLAGLSLALKDGPVRATILRGINAARILRAGTKK